MHAARIATVLIALAVAGCGSEEVPDVRGSSLPKARKALEAAGFEVKSASADGNPWTEENPWGTAPMVVGQTPPPGASVPSGSKVKLSWVQD